MVQNDEKARTAGVERLQSLFDAGTFVELSAYAKRSLGEPESVSCGYGAIDGRLTFAFAQDSGCSGGAFGERHAKKIASLSFVPHISLEYRQVFIDDLIYKGNLNFEQLISGERRNFCVQDDQLKQIDFNGAINIKEILNTILLILISFLLN